MPVYRVYRKINNIYVHICLSCLHSLFLEIAIYYAQYAFSTKKEINKKKLERFIREKTLQNKKGLSLNIL